METLKAEIVQILLDYLEEGQAATITILSTRAIMAFREYVNYPATWTEEQILADLTRHKSCIADLALFEAIQQGAEFQTMHIESGAYRMWNNKGNVYTQHGVVPFATL